MHQPRSPRQPCAALYHRVSTIDQHPDAARAELRAAAECLVLVVALDVDETGSGATTAAPACAKRIRLGRGACGTLLLS